MRYELNKSEFPKRLKELMEEYNETVYTLAEKLSLSAGTISRYSAGLISPKITTIEFIARLYSIDPAWLSGYAVPKRNQNSPSTVKAIRIPVFGRLPAGVPIDALEDILCWEELDTRQFDLDHEYFGLLVHGDSMYPEYLDGDIIIVRQSEDADSGKDVLVHVNGYEAELKRLYRYRNGNIEFRAINPAYESKKFTPEEIKTEPVVIRGIVKELRRKK